jgi:hypothetical protein
LPSHKALQKDVAEKKLSMVRQKIIICINVVAILFSLFWIYSSHFDTEPIVTTLGLVATLLNVETAGSQGKIINLNPKIKYLFLVIILLSILIFIGFGIENSNTGIKGNYNNNNDINISTGK